MQQAKAIYIVVKCSLVPGHRFIKDVLKLGMQVLMQTKCDTTHVIVVNTSLANAPALRLGIQVAMQWPSRKMMLLE